jgi:hypothetical protein
MRRPRTAAAGDEETSLSLLPAAEATARRAGRIQRAGTIPAVCSEEDAAGGGMLV